MDEDEKIKSLLEDLGSEDLIACNAAIENLGRLGDARAVKPLLRIYRSDHEYRYYHTISRAINALGDPAFKILIRSLTDEDEEIRAAAADFLGELGDERVAERVVEALVGILQDKNADGRPGEAGALGRIADPRAVEALLAVMDSRYNSEAVEALAKIEEPTVVDWAVCNAAIEILGRSADARAVKPLLRINRSDSNNNYLSSIKSALDALGDPAFEILIRSLTSEDEEIRVAASVLLGELGDARAVEPLIKTLTDEETWVRQKAVESLGLLGDVRAVEPLIKTLTRENYSIRRAAAHALGKTGDTRAVEPLIKALKDKDSGVCSAAAWALGKIGDTRAVEPLIKAYVTSNSNDFLIRIIAVLQTDFKAPIIPLFVRFLLSIPEDEDVPFINNALSLFLRRSWSLSREQLRKQLFPLKPLLVSLVLTGDEDVRNNSKALLKVIEE